MSRSVGYPPRLTRLLRTVGPPNKPANRCLYHEKTHDCSLANLRKWNRQEIVHELKLGKANEQHYIRQFATVTIAISHLFGRIPMSNLRGVQDVHIEIAEVVAGIRKSFEMLENRVAYDLGRGKPCTFAAHALHDRRSLVEDLICSGFRLVKYIEDVVPIMHNVKTDDKASLAILRRYGKRISNNCRSVMQDVARLSQIRESHLMTSLFRVLATCRAQKVKTVQACAFEMRHRLLQAQLLEIFDYAAALGFLHSLAGRVQGKEFLEQKLDFDQVLKAHLGLNDGGFESERVCRDLFVD